MLKTTRFDAVNFLNSEQDIKLYLESVFEENDPQLITVALGDVARARRKMAAAAKLAGVRRENLYRSLSGKTKPSFETITKVTNSLGYRLMPVAI
ncbi:MAG: putative addiction module antidote protein [Rickettsiales bacterium]|jgi:probable addiction module antidote protein|nr:putative addiction module antidote protein [Rickettsiales bacterium]